MSSSRDDEAIEPAPGVVANVRDMAMHFVREVLGVDTISRHTLALGFATALIGFPLVAEVVKLLVEQGLQQGGVSGPFVPLITAAFLAAGILVVWAAAAFSLQCDRRYGERLALAGTKAKPEHRALLFSCSRDAPVDWVGELTRMPPDARLARSGDGRARWLQLLIRSLTFHAPSLERVLLIVDPSQIDPEARAALLALVEQVLSEQGERHEALRDLSYVFLDDVNNAEGVRSTVAGVLAELCALMPDRDKIGIQITGGTAATSVGITLAACTHRVDVLYFRQDEAPTDAPRSPPVRVDTDIARIRIRGRRLQD